MESPTLPSLPPCGAQPAQPQSGWSDVEFLSGEQRWLELISNFKSLPLVGQCDQRNNPLFHERQLFHQSMTSPPGCQGSE